MNPTEAGFCWVDGKPYTADDPLSSAKVIEQWGERRHVSTLVHRNGTSMSFGEVEPELFMALWRGVDEAAQ